MVNSHHRRPLFLSIHLLLLCVLLVQLQLKQEEEAVATILPWETRVASFIPRRIQIPQIGLDAPVMTTGLTGDGRMEVPAQAGDVGWFGLGTQPGEQGSAVLAGHLDTVGELPGVFWKLDQVQPGDDIILSDADGNQRWFRAIRSKVYEDKKSPLQEIFGDSRGRFLNLITCDGVWLENEKNYDKRLVVFTEFQDVTESYSETINLGQTR
jgi:sortase (surface protein transpeptidase)